MRRITPEEKGGRGGGFVRESKVSLCNIGISLHNYFTSTAFFLLFCFIYQLFGGGRIES